MPWQKRPSVEERRMDAAIGRSCRRSAVRMLQLVAAWSAVEAIGHPRHLQTSRRQIRKTLRTAESRSQSRATSFVFPLGFTQRNQGSLHQGTRTLIAGTRALTAGAGALTGDSGALRGGAGAENRV